jgi:hypothetical protein
MPLAEIILRPIRRDDLVSHDSGEGSVHSRLTGIRSGLFQAIQAAIVVDDHVQGLLCGGASRCLVSGYWRPSLPPVQEPRGRVAIRHPSRSAVRTGWRYCLRRCGRKRRSMAYIRPCRKGYCVVLDEWRLRAVVQFDDLKMNRSKNRKTLSLEQPLDKRQRIESVYLGHFTTDEICACAN